LVLWMLVSQGTGLAFLGACGNGITRLGVYAGMMVEPVALFMEGIGTKTKCRAVPCGTTRRHREWNPPMRSTTSIDRYRQSDQLAMGLITGPMSGVIGPLSPPVDHWVWVMA
jgi:hypothetical protein